jgi:hypothetical protein
MAQQIHVAGDLLVSVKPAACVVEIDVPKRI